MSASQTDIKRKAQLYPLVYAWARMMGSYSYYVEKMLDKAIEANAPVDATSDNDDGTWTTVKDIRNPDAIRRLRPYVSKELAERLGTIADTRAKLNQLEAEQAQVDYLVKFLEWIIDHNIDLEDGHWVSQWATSEQIAKAFRADTGPQ